MEFLDLSSPGASGQFIEASKTNEVVRSMPVWRQIGSIRKKLKTVEAELHNCNQPAWLMGFAEYCHRKRKDFTTELPRKVHELETSRRHYEELWDRRIAELNEVSPVLAAAARVTPDLKDTTQSRAFDGSVEVARRNVVIKKYPTLTASKLDRKLVWEEVPIPPPWSDQYEEITNWTLAYGNPVVRKRIDKIISLAKKHMGLR